MVSMTDFLQQQEFVQESAEVEPEKTIEELSTAVVESYMEMAAAFATASNAFECAEIVAFCETSSIQVPETAKVIVESAWDAIKSFFAKAWDWIRSLITAAVAAFAASRVRALIGKLRDMQKQGKTLEGNKLMAAGFEVSLIEILFNYLSTFNEKVIAPLKSEDKETTIGTVTDDVDKFEEDLKKLVGIKFKTLSAAGNADNRSVFDPSQFKFSENVENTIAGEYTAAAAEYAKSDKSGEAPGYVVEIGTVIDTLEKLNKYDIPRRGGKLLKELGFDAKSAKAKANDKNDQVAIDKTLVRKIEKVARMFARLYDRISISIAWITDAKDFKDVKPSSKEEFKKDVKAAKDASNKSKVKDLKQESAEVETEGTEVTTEAEEAKIEETQPDVKTESDDATAAEAPVADEGVVEEQATPEVVTAAQVIAKAAANVDAYFDN